MPIGMWDNMFDVDFSDQEFVFNYLSNKYGADSYARIAAFGTYTPRNVCRRVMSTFEHPNDVINKISKLIPDLCPNLEEAYKNAPELLEYKKKYKEEFEVIERLEGVVSHESQHAGGVIIYPNLADVLPIKTVGDIRTKRIIAFDKYMLEDMGHYKYDILGLKTLPVIQDTINTIPDEIDLYEIDYEDQNVYKMLHDGHISGVFQLSEQAQKISEQKPTSFLDLIAINALIRPGVADWNEYIERRNGKPWKVHPDRMPYMAETSGLIAYQEQYLLDCKTFPGWDLAYADKYVRKNKDILNDTELRDKFINDSVKCGYDKNEMTDLWAEISGIVAGGYGFNKSHSASYSIISYQTAWLKHHYPAHFYAALMSAQKTDGDGQQEINQYINECKNIGVKMLPPDINQSGDTFIALDTHTIQYKINTIRHVGESAVEHIKELRPIKSFDDFMERRKKQHIRANVLVNLIKSGCFDFDNPKREELLWLADMSNRTPKEVKNDIQLPKHEVNSNTYTKWEKAVLGTYISSNPLEKYGFKNFYTEYRDGENCLIGGDVVKTHFFKDKRGGDMCFASVETLFGTIKVVIFSSTMNEEVAELFQIDNRLLIRGKRSANDVLFDSGEILE